MSDKKMEVARKRARAKMRFMWHLAAYVVATIALIVANNSVDTDNQWWIWPALLWGLVIAAHFIRSFVLSNSLEKRIIETERENIDGEDE